MKIALFITLLIVSSILSDDGVMNVDLLATRDCNLTVSIDDFILPFTMYEGSHRHFSYHPAEHTYDEHLPLTFRVDGSDDIPQTIMFPLVSSYTYEVLHFSNVSISFRGSYTCEYGMEGKRCAGRPTPSPPHPLSPPPVAPTTSTTTTSSLSTTHNADENNSQFREFRSTMGKLLALFLIAILIIYYNRIVLTAVFIWICESIRTRQAEEQRVFPEPPPYTSTETTETGKEMPETNTKNMDNQDHTVSVFKDSIV